MTTLAAALLLLKMSFFVFLNILLAFCPFLLGLKGCLSYRPDKEEKNVILLYNALRLI
jgi:hypothetical protein